MQCSGCNLIAVEECSAESRPCGQGPYRELRAVWEEFFDAPPGREVAAVFERMINRGFVGVEHLRRVFASLQMALSLPRVPSVRFAEHFVTWLEIINHGYFTPIITSPRRLQLLVECLAASGEVTLTRPAIRIADVGTGQPPFTTMDLAERLAEAHIFGFNLYSASALVRRPDAAYAIFDKESELRGVHAPRPQELHQLITDWANTRAMFASGLRRLQSKLGQSQTHVIDQGWELIVEPAERLCERSRNRHLVFHDNVTGGFDLAPLEPGSLDLIWTFNCLLHYGRTERQLALQQMAAALRDGGVIFEGYTSASGKHAVYQLWRRRQDILEPWEFGWTLSNLRYPLWPLHDDDPQVELLNRVLRMIKRDVLLAARIASELQDRLTLPRSTIADIAAATAAASGGPVVSRLDRFIIHDIRVDHDRFGVEALRIAKN